MIWSPCRTKSRNAYSSCSGRGPVGSASCPACSLTNPQAGSSRYLGRKGLFTREIERALAASEIDIAVHSAKDLPSERTPELELRATLPRSAIEDVLVQKTPGGFASLRGRARVATGSVRRQHQLRWRLPGIDLIDLRGNVPTRLRKLIANDWDAIVLARAGLERLGYDLSHGSFVFEGATLHCEILPIEKFLPAGGQGIIAMQLRTGDGNTKALIDRVNDAKTLLCLKAEREFLRLLQGDCDSPVGVLATIESNMMKLRAQVFEPGKAKPWSGEVAGSEEEGGRLAAELVHTLKIH